MKAVILGAGDLGATVARKLAESGLCREIVLFDTALGTAQGKALDLLESGPVLGFRTRLLGADTVETLAGADVVISADLFRGEGRPLDEGKADAFFQAFARPRGQSVLILSEDYATRLAERAVLRSQYPPRAVIGSAPLAVASALRADLARALGQSARGIQIPLLGMLPASLVVPWSMASVAGVPVERLTHVSVLRRLSSALSPRRRFGPFLLASAAAALARDVLADRRVTYPVLACLQGEYGQRDRFMVVPARIGRCGVIEIPELPLDPVDRVAFERLRHG